MYQHADCSRRWTGITLLAAVALFVTNLDHTSAQPQLVAPSGGGGFPVQNPYALSLSRIRAINGSNSGTRLGLGMADTILLRWAPAYYPGDGSGDQIIAAPERPNPRTISNTIAAQTTTTPNDREMSDFVWAWGQFIDHDLGLTFTDPLAGHADIEIEDPLDPLGPNPIPFERSEYVYGGQTGHREQLNALTAFIDASNVYGSSTERMTALREFRGGRLLEGDHHLLPFNTVGLENDPAPVADYFLAGDRRANENLVLTSLHTLFVREHNRLANLIALHDPTANDDQVFHLARKLVGAEMQLITYQEFLPTLLGPRAPRLSEARSNAIGHPGIATEFSAAFFRIGHTMLSPNLQRWEASTALGALPLRDAFFRPSYLTADPLNMDRLLSGLQTQLAQEIDNQVVDDVRNFLFGPPGAGGLDLASLNIQRGRDHGLRDYNSIRAAYGLPRRRTFAEISDRTSVQTALEALYGNPFVIDPWVGALAEPHIPRTSVGEIMYVALCDQFRRTLLGDKFNVVVDADLRQPLVEAILPLASLKLSDVIRMNTAQAEVANDVFHAATPYKCDISVRYERAGHRLFVNGSHQDNRVQIAQLTNSMYLVTALGTSRVNGEKSVVIRTLPRPNVTIDMGPGHDRVQMIFCRFGDVCLSLGDGDDVSSSLFSVCQNMLLDAGTGTNSISPPEGLPHASP
ncbi:MAG: peroxidase family protein [Planctomycetaceae bacterium]